MLSLLLPVYMIIGYLVAAFITDWGKPTDLNKVTSNCEYVLIVIAVTIFWPILMVYAIVLGTLGWAIDKTMGGPKC